MHKQDVVLGSRIGSSDGLALRHVGNRENRQVAFRNPDLLGLALDYSYTERLETNAECRPVSGGGGRVMVSATITTLGVRLAFAMSREEFLKGRQYRGGWLDETGVKHVAGDQHESRTPASMTLSITRRIESAENPPHAG